ncbi:MAG: hypothetical protein ACJ79K_14460 [Gemmatimonadaceae bacterium]
MSKRSDEQDLSTGAWEGYESLDEAIEPLRRGRFRLERRYFVTGRGLVVNGIVMEGRVAQGMVLLAPAKRCPDVIVELQIRAVEEVPPPRGPAAITLVLGDV